MVRLVKGAYWDTEVKRAQERGLADYPVFTRKAMTDLSYIACTRKLLAARSQALSAIRHPQRADRRERDRGCRRRRRLRVPAPARHGRGALRSAARRGARARRAGSMRRSAAIAICWLIWCAGCWRTARIPRSSRPPPIRRCRSRHPEAAAELDRRRRARAPSAHSAAARSLWRRRGGTRPASSSATARASTPCWRTCVARARLPQAPPAEADAARRARGDGMAAPARRSRPGSGAGRATRARHPRTRRRSHGGGARAADRADAGGRAARRWTTRLSELREAVDFCRYYAAEARRALVPQPHAGPDRRDRTSCAIAGAASSSASARGISRWRSLLGQVSRRARRRQCRGGEAGRADAADCGRSRAHAASRPACRRARCISCRATARSARRWWPIRASPASPSPARPRSAAPSTARSPPRTAPIVPLIAETGGINAMIVDATALPEQVTDDVIASAFRSAGQRCSALRLLCVQEDVADRMIEMIAGAARELDARRSARSGDPCRAGDRRRRQAAARPLDRRQWPRRAACASAGTRASRCRRAAASCRRPSSRSTARAISARRCSARSCTSCAGAPTRSTRCSTRSPATATASRSASIPASIRRVEQIVARLANGNVYVNRSMIGAVVGTQPFGGTRPLRHRAEGRRAELSAPLRHRAGR